MRRNAMLWGVLLVLVLAPEAVASGTYDVYITGQINTVGVFGFPGVPVEDITIEVWGTTRLTTTSSAMTAPTSTGASNGVRRSPIRTA